MGNPQSPQALLHYSYMLCLSLKIILPVLGFRLKRPALLPVWILYDTLPFSPSSSSRAITYKITNLSIKSVRQDNIIPNLKKRIPSFFYVCCRLKCDILVNTGIRQKKTCHSPYRLILHDADSRRWAEHWSVVIFICHKHSGRHWTPAPLRGIHCLVGGPYHKVERRRWFPI